MSTHRVRWLRFLRTVVALVALVAARPAMAAPRTVDHVVLVAQVVQRDEQAREADDAVEDASKPAALVGPGVAPRPTLASFVLVAHKYLRNCSISSA